MDSTHNHFAGQFAVVTGASSGIGRAIALGLAAHGATVCLVGRNTQRLEHVAAHARATGAVALAYQADLSQESDIRGLAAWLQQGPGCVNILIHSAAVITLGQFDSARVEDFDQQYRVNVRAPYVLTQALLPMLAAQQGQIVFINSSSGLKAGTGLGQYAATKHGLKALADSLRDEVNPYGVRVLSVFPGRTAGPMQEEVHAVEGKPYRPATLLQPEDVSAVTINALGLPYTAEVTEICIRPLIKPEPTPPSMLTGRRQDR